MINYEGLAPNQKYVRIRKEDCDKQHLYATINLKALEAAMRRFSGRNANAFILWVYFARNRPNYGFALSSAAVEQATGIKRDAYNNAVKLLREGGYLKPVGNKDSRFYEFVELPPEQSATQIVKVAPPSRQKRV